jgi:LacI family transcriptional regulator, gluconate utilization system Gnt-I transcriptional repressor
LVDVAALAGVTTMTVSRFLREPDRVSPLTSTKIREALSTTGYTPNKQAGGLASGKSPVIAAVIPNMGNSLFAETVQALCEVFQRAGYELLLSATNYSLEREEELVRAMLGWMPSALIVAGRRHSSGTLQMMRNANGWGVPVVEIWDKSSPDSEFIQVGFNHHEAGALMAQHLITRGYADLVYVDSGVGDDLRAHERGQGFVQHALAAGRTVRTVVAPQTEPMAAGRNVMQTLASTRLPRAVAFANDHLAIGAYLHAQNAGIAVPDRVALLGFGDLPLSAQLGAGISSVITQRFQIGYAAAQRILRELGRTDAAADDALALTLQPEIVQRATT